MVPQASRQLSVHKQILTVTIYSVYHVVYFSLDDGAQKIARAKHKHLHCLHLLYIQAEGSRAFSFLSLFLFSLIAPLGFLCAANARSDILKAHNMESSVPDHVSLHIRTFFCF